MALLILNLDVRWRWVVKTTSQPLFRQEIAQVHATVRVPGTVWSSMCKTKSLVYIGVRAPDRPARSEPLTRLGRTDPLQVVHFVNPLYFKGVYSAGTAGNISPIVIKAQKSI